MTDVCEAIERIKAELKPFNATLVAVSKTKPASLIQQAIDCYQLDFGENYVQELVSKHEQLPTTVNWHFIGHLQSNKIKYIAPFINLVHGADSLQLLKEINKQAAKSNRIIDVLLQIFIAREETKFGYAYEEAEELIMSDELRSLNHISIKGLMGMASNTDDEKQIRNEFKTLKTFFDGCKKFQSANFEMKVLSMGMSSDYKIALEEGSNMVRIGSLIFGERIYTE
jgi:PLP dependent protein